METTVLGTNPKSDNVAELVASHLFTNLPTTEQINELKTLFNSTIAMCNDKGAKKIIELMSKIYLSINDKESTIGFRKWLREVYWEIPVSGNENRPIMVKTQLWILDQAINDWNPKDRGNHQISVEAFRFLIAVYNPMHTYDDRYTRQERIPDESDHEWKARGRTASDTKKSRIKSLLMQQNVNFPPEEIIKWLEQPHLPSDFEEILIMAWFRNRRSIWDKRNIIASTQAAEPLFKDSHYPSHNALSLMRLYAESISRRERSIELLIQTMKNGEHNPRARQIGKSRAVIAKEISYATNNTALNELTITIILPDHFNRQSEVPDHKVFSKALCHEMIKRAQDHITEWLKRQSTGQAVKLIVRGGPANLNIEESFNTI